MKVCTALVATALTVSMVDSLQSHIRNGDVHRSLADATNSTTYHMKPVRVLQARVQGDAPVWNETASMFTSSYGANFDAKYRAALDTVNLASVEGALMYVQAEGINYNSRSNDTKCVRKNTMRYVVFYDIVFAQTNETLALYEQEYGPFLPMDGGQCTPVSGADATAVFSKPCDYINGDNGQPKIGPFVGGELKDTDVRAPYPNTYWYSYPNSAVKLKWAAKTDTNRAAAPGGLCAPGKTPDGITCTFSYRIAGWVPIDDVVGITKLTFKNDATKMYTNFTEFCNDGGVEFKASVTNGTFEDGLDFWKDPKDSTKNAARAAKVVATYSAMLTSTSSQVTPADIGHMTALPTIASLTAANPKCYETSKSCVAAPGCKRTLYGQICVPCTTSDTDCETVPSGYTFPALAKAVGTTGSTGDKTANATTAGTPTTAPATSAPTPTPTTTATSGAASVSMIGLASFATLALTFLLG